MASVISSEMGSRIVILRTGSFDLRDGIFDAISMRYALSVMGFVDNTMLRTGAAFDGRRHTVSATGFADDATNRRVASSINCCFSSIVEDCIKVNRFSHTACHFRGANVLLYMERLLEERERTTVRSVGNIRLVLSG